MIWPPGAAEIRGSPERAVFLKFPSGAEADFVLVFTVYYVHRVLTSFQKVSFRPIFARGIPVSAFFVFFLDFPPEAILIGKTQYFENTFFPFLHLRACDVTFVPLFAMGCWPLFSAAFSKNAKTRLSYK